MSEASPIHVVVKLTDRLFEITIVTYMYIYNFGTVFIILQNQ